jgi:hypothetical protein
VQACLRAGFRRKLAKESRWLASQSSIAAGSSECRNTRSPATHSINKSVPCMLRGARPKLLTFMALLLLGSSSTPGVRRAGWQPGLGVMHVSTIELTREFIGQRLSVSLCGRPSRHTHACLQASRIHSDRLVRHLLSTSCCSGHVRRPWPGPSRHASVVFRLRW